MADDAGALLVRSGLVSASSLDAARVGVGEHGGTLGEHLVMARAVDDDALTEFYRQRLLVPRVNPNTLARLPARVVASIPADMAVELRAAELLTLEAAWKLEQKTATDTDMAIAKLKASEMLQMVADEALQIHGGMGLMSELPLERIWRDARIERIWDGTSEVQRHIISRALLRPLGG